MFGIIFYKRGTLFYVREQNFNLQKIVATNLTLLPVNKSSMQKKALPMSHNAANLAVMQENKQETMQAELQENYLKLHVPNVAAHVKFHFSLATIVLFTAVIALQTKR